MSTPKWQVPFSPSLGRSAPIATRTTSPERVVASPAVDRSTRLLRAPERRSLSRRPPGRLRPWLRRPPHTRRPSPRPPRRAHPPLLPQPRASAARRPRRHRQQSQRHRRPVARPHQSPPGQLRQQPPRPLCALRRLRLHRNPPRAAPSRRARLLPAPLPLRPRGLPGRRRWPTASSPPPRPSRPRRRRARASPRALRPALRHRSSSPPRAPRPPGWLPRELPRHLPPTARARQLRSRTPRG